MIFTLDAVQAKYGDALILRHGKPGSPGLIVIDGGPPGVYGTERAPGPLRRKLMALKEELSPAKPLPIQLLMVSHIDADHIAGVLELTSELVSCDKDGNPLPYHIQGLWHNSFSDLLEDAADELFRTVEGKVKSVAADQAPATKGLPKHEAAVVASVPQGRQLRVDAKALSIPVNATKPLKGLVAAPDSGALKMNMGDGLTFTVLGPKVGQLENLRKTWKAQIKALKDAGKLDESHAAAFGDDKSVYNLSSIIVLAESGGKTMLLTGDAHCDHILGGLVSCGKIKAGEPLHVDLLKLPHHGSMRNITQAFFEQITADHYVISANGRDDNPDLATIEALTRARDKVKAKPAVIHLTTREDEQHPKKTAIAEAIRFIEAHKTEGCYSLDLREKGKLSVVVDLST